MKYKEVKSLLRLSLNHKSGAIKAMGRELNFELVGTYANFCKLCLCFSASKTLINFLLFSFVEIVEIVAVFS